MMKMRRVISVGLLCVLCLMVTSCGTTVAKDDDVLYQVSTINALLAGYYDGQVSVKTLKEKGDIGIGTFNNLDGEMIQLDGSVYQAKSDGTVVEAADTDTVPFAAVTFFNKDRYFAAKDFGNLATLEKTLDTAFSNPNLFYCFKIKGEFSYVKVRSVPAQKKPYPVLSEVTKKQAVFEYNNIRGTIVGFWCPAYVAGINVPGYHLHFISDDKGKGGHLLDIKGTSAAIQVDQTEGFQIELTDQPAFGKLTLVEDKSKELAKVEK